MKADHVVTILHCAKSVYGNRQMQLNMDHRQCHNPPEIITSNLFYIVAKNQGNNQHFFFNNLLK